ncbi:MAG: carbamoyltransferase [Candidatus Coatesbacteria bacterium]|nr:carbamoyltransferase [Candidatus Coatesbacteria bacterium]
MKILGISAYYHDSAAALVIDGEIIAAAQEERFTRKKHDFNFPKHAVEYCLAHAGISTQELDYVGFYDKPFLKFERLLETYLSYAPFGIRSFLKAMPLWLSKKLWMRDVIKKELGFEGEVLFTEHHESHAASAFFPSPFQEAAIITMDGVGEWATASYGAGTGNEVKIAAELQFPHSLGLLYSAFTYYTGFRVNSGEYKVMGLAPYGEPRFVDLIHKYLIKVRDDGSFVMNMDYFDYCAGLTMTNERFHKLFGGPPRKPESPIQQRDMDVARSIQEVTEEIMLKMANHVHNETGMKNLCLAGGVALNCVGNGRILRDGPFEGIWIQPAAGDAGGALGVALFIWHQYLGNPREADGVTDTQKASLLGPSYSDDEIEAFLKSQGAAYDRIPEEKLPETIAKLIASEKVVGLCLGRMEFGPRALGSRSIIGDARSEQMQTVMNKKIKFRESFRPFAPTVLREDLSDYFEMSCDSPYMLLVAPVKKERRIEHESARSLFGLDKLKLKRSDIPAITHVDYSARVQTVDKRDNPLYHAIIAEFKKMTGCPVIINTSFNVRGEPIVCTPQDAYKCFMRTCMDFLAVGSFILDKNKQPAWVEPDDWKKEYPPD